MKKFYITTAIDYVNNLPHLGTAYEKIGADALARYLRMEGHDVHFQMGNDEHAANVKKEADRRGIHPKRYCDEMRHKFEEIWKSLGISYDGFVQTSAAPHHAAVKAFIGMLNPADIEKRPYKGWYCESCEAFLTDKDLVNGECQTHKRKPQWLEEENYFFKLSQYQKRLLAHYEKHPDFILPEIRKNEIVSLVRSGLQGISISRSSFDWGIPFPGGDGHVVYVWFDALINYLTAVGFPQETKDFKKWWPADLHVIGKDITRFHCVIWPAMLMSAQKVMPSLQLPKTIFGHGFVFLKGEKMSKTLGNIVTPLDIVPKYGADALRYYLLRESSFGADGDFTWENFIKRYNSDLANDLGNLLNRTLGMANKYLDGRIKRCVPKNPKYLLGNLWPDKIEDAKQRVIGAMDYKKHGDINFHKALTIIWEVIRAADQYIDSSAPWKLDKEGKKDEVARVLYNVVDTLRNIAVLIKPFLPDTSKKIWEQIGCAEKKEWKELTLESCRWGMLGVTGSVQVETGTPIFPRIETADVIPAEAGIQRKHVDPRLRGDDVTKESTMEISIEDFQKIDLRVAEIKAAEKVEGADRLLKLQIDIGGEPRQIVAGVAQHYTSEELVGKKVVVVANLKPATIRGVESRGMLLAASDTSGLSILVLDKPGTIGSGARVK